MGSHCVIYQQYCFFANKITLVTRVVNWLLMEIDMEVNVTLCLRTKFTVITDDLILMHSVDMIFQFTIQPKYNIALKAPVFLYHMLMAYFFMDF